MEISALDRVIAAISPKWGAKRLQSRMTMQLANQFYGSFGGYDGASTRRRETNTWQPFPSDADTASVFDLTALRARSRDSLRNEPLATGAVNTAVTNVVGAGLTLHSQIDAQLLGMDEEAADAWQCNTEREWALFADTPECDLNRTLNFAGLTELAFRSTLENGDVFALLPRKERPGSVYSLRIQLIEADRVSNPRFSLNTSTLVSGVEKDADGAAAAYHIQRQHPGNALTLNSNQFSWDRYPAFGAKTGLRNVIHLYRPLRIGQTRGIPYLAPVIEPLKMLGRYKQAELMAAVVSSMFTVFIKTEGAQGLAGLPTAPGANPVVTYGQDATPASADVRLGNGMVVELAKGESIETANPGRPNAGFDPFVMAILRQIGVALEIPFEILIKHYTSSYSAARAAILDAWKFFSSRRSWLASNFCQVIYEIWLTEAVARGRITAPGFFSDPLIRKAYCGSHWTGPGRGMINEVQETDAAEKRISLGITTASQETAAYDGGDWDAKQPRRLKERRLRAEAGLPTPGVSTKDSTATPSAPQQSEAAEVQGEGD
jgi:lambda family phage portal protein